MSETYSIACHDCQIMLWIGQSPVGSDLSRGYLYTADPHPKFQRDFFFAHIGHRLEFNASQLFDGDYWEIDWDDLGTLDAPILHRLEGLEDIVRPLELPE